MAKTKAQIQAQREENPQAWNKKRLGIIAYTLIMMVYGIYSLVLSIQAYSNFSDITTDFGNFKETPLVSVTKRATDCNQGEVSLFQYEWKGTQSGCDCRSATNAGTYNLTKKFYTQACNSTMINAGCQNILAQPQTSTKYFSDGTIAGKLNLCGKKLGNEYQFYKKAPKSETDKCSFTEQMCGSVDHPESLFCVPSNEQCPINYMEIGQININPNVNRFTNNAFHIDVSSTQKLYISRSSEYQPVSELRVNEGGGVYGITPGRTDYILYNEPRSDCARDKRFMALQEINEKLFFQLNGISTLVANLPDYEVSENYIYRNYYRNFIFWKIDARDQLKILVENEDQVSTIASFQLAIMIINILVVIAVSIVLTFSQVYNLLGKDVPCIAGDGAEEQERIKKIKKILTYGAKLLQFPFCVWAFALANQIRGFFKGLADLKPSDQETNDNFKDLSELIQTKVWQADLIMIIMLIITIVIDVAMYAFKRYKASKKAKEVLPDNENQVGEEEGDKVRLKQPSQNGGILLQSSQNLAGNQYQQQQGNQYQQYQGNQYQQQQGNQYNQYQQQPNHNQQQNITEDQIDLPPQ